MRVGLAMSGGGVRGLAHVGVIKALWENGINITYYSGSSAGALVGVMAAAGCTIEEMLDFWTETKLFDFWNLDFSDQAILNTMKYLKPIKKYVKADTFEELEDNLTVCATAMLRGELEYFNSGDLWPIVLASATFPIVFSPVEWKNEIYMDGGIIDNFPVEPLDGECDFLIGINVDPHKRIRAEDLDTFKDIMERVMDLRFQGDTEEKEKKCDVIIHPEQIDNYRTFQTGALLEIFYLGYESGLKKISEIKEKMDEKRKS